MTVRKFSIASSHPRTPPRVCRSQRGVMGWWAEVKKRMWRAGGMGCCRGGGWANPLTSTAFRDAFRV